MKAQIILRGCVGIYPKTRVCRALSKRIVNYVSVFIPLLILIIKLTMNHLRPRLPADFKICCQYQLSHICSLAVKVYKELHKDSYILVPVQLRKLLYRLLLNEKTIVNSIYCLVLFKQHLDAIGILYMCCRMNFAIKWFEFL